jgi:cell division protein FtsW (lipid II flippase)
VLYQLALDGWANPKNTAALQQLESKLLICRMPMFRIMNMSFRRFVGSSEHISEIEQWEKQQKRSTWRAVRLMLVGLFLLLVVWLLHSQAALSQEVTAYVAGIATLVTAISTLFTKSEKAVADSSSQT